MMGLREIFQKEWPRVLQERTDRVRSREHSMAHGARHGWAIISIGCKIAESYVSDDGLLSMKVALGGLYHDSVRPIPNNSAARELHHGQASAAYAEERLASYNLNEDVSKEIIAAASEGSMQPQGCLAARIVGLIDGIEVRSPIAPLRRAVYVGEIRSRQPRLLPREHTADYLLYMMRITRGGSVPLDGSLVPRDQAELLENHNLPFWNQLCEELSLCPGKLMEEYTDLTSKGDVELLNAWRDGIAEDLVLPEHGGYEGAGAVGIVLYGIQRGLYMEEPNDFAVYQDLKEMIERNTKLILGDRQYIDFSRQFIETATTYIDQWTPSDWQRYPIA